MTLQKTKATSTTQEGTRGVLACMTFEFPMLVCLKADI